MKHEELLKLFNEKYPLIPHTGAGRLFSLVRRMKAEKEHNLPIHLRTGFGISTEIGKAANQMTPEEWEKFYADVSEQLKQDYPHLYTQVFK